MLDHSFETRNMTTQRTPCRPLRAEQSTFDSRPQSLVVVLGGGGEEVRYPVLLRDELAPDLLVLHRRRFVDGDLCWPIYM